MKSEKSLMKFLFLIQLNSVPIRVFIRPVQNFLPQTEINKFSSFSIIQVSSVKSNKPNPGNASDISSDIEYFMIPANFLQIANQEIFVTRNSFYDFVAFFFVAF